jgi:transposase
MDSDDRLRSARELAIVQTAKQPDANTFSRRPTVPGIGKLLALVLRYAIHNLQRFPRVQACVSSGRLVKCAKDSAGQRDGTSGPTIGNAYLTWAFAEAAGLFLRHHPRGQQYLARLEKQHGQGKALTGLAHKLAPAVYDMLNRETAFDMRTFLHE